MDAIVQLAASMAVMPIAAGGVAGQQQSQSREQAIEGLVAYLNANFCMFRKQLRD